MKIFFGIGRVSKIPQKGRFYPRICGTSATHVEVWPQPQILGISQDQIQQPVPVSEAALNGSLGVQKALIFIGCMGFLPVPETYPKAAAGAYELAAAHVSAAAGTQ